MKTFMLDDLGDLTAIPGSKEWAIAVRNKLQVLVKDRNTVTSHIIPYLELIEEHEGYKTLENEKGLHFVSVEDFLNARYPFGLGGEIERQNGGYALRRDPGRPKKNDVNLHHSLPRERLGAANKSYILARLERDHPDILADFNAGKYKSARQAGIAAGFVKDRKYIQVAPYPAKIAKKLKEVLTQEQVSEVIELLSDF